MYPSPAQIAVEQNIFKEKLHKEMVYVILIDPEESKCKEGRVGNAITVLIEQGLFLVERKKVERTPRRASLFVEKGKADWLSQFEPMANAN